MRCEIYRPAPQAITPQDLTVSRDRKRVSPPAVSPSSAIFPSPATYMYFLMFKGRTHRRYFWSGRPLKLGRWEFANHRTSARESINQTIRKQALYTHSIGTQVNFASSRRFVRVKVPPAFFKWNGTWRRLGTGGTLPKRREKAKFSWCIEYLSFWNYDPATSLSETRVFYVPTARVSSKAQTNVLLALTNVLFLKANILEGFLNILFPVVYMNQTKAAWSSITVITVITVHVRQNDREGVCLTGSRARSNSFRFQKKEPRQDCSSTLWLFELCRPSQFAPMATVLNFTRSFLHLGPPAAADSPAASGWAGEVLHRSIPTSTYRNFDYFFECLTKVRSSFSPFEFAPANEGIEPSNIRLSPSLVWGCF